MVKSAQSVVVEFTTANPSTGASQNGDSLPTGTLYVDGTANAATVTVANITSGVYSASVTLPALTAGQVVGIRIAATVATVAGQGIVWQDVADTVLASDTYARIGAPVGASISADVATRLATTGYAAPLSAADTRTALGLALANLDAQLAALPTDADVNASCDAAIADAALATSASLTLALKLLRNKVVTDPATGVMTVYDDNGTDVLFTARIYESTDTATAYAGGAIDRKERLA